MITVKQRQVLDFIKYYVYENQIAPTEAEIAENIGIKSRGVVHRYVKALNDAGYVKIIPNRRRNITLVETEEKYATFLPIQGRIAAGQPIEAMIDRRELNVSDLTCGDRYALEVKGDSMIGDNICDGDYVICESCQNVGMHDIAVVLVDGEEVTLKRLRILGDGYIELLPSNPNLLPQKIEAHRIQIQAKYVGLLRLN